MAALFIVVTTGVVLVIVLWIFSRPRSDLPSPPGHPIIGNLLQIIRPRSDLWLTEWSQKLGPVFRVCLLHINVVVVNDYDSIYTVLVKQGKEFAGRPHFFTKRLMFLRDNNPGIVLSDPTAEWKFLRQTIHNYLKRFEKGLRRLEGVNMAVIEDMVCEMTRHGGQTPFNPRSLIHKTTMNIICVFLLGRKFSENDPLFSKLIDISDQFVEAFTPGSEGFELEVMWFLRHFGNKNYKKLQRSAKDTQEVWAKVRQMIEQDLADTSHDKGGIMHDLLAAIRDKKGAVPESFNEGAVMTGFYDVIIGSISTTGKTFYSFLNIMACHPEVQARLRREVDDVVGSERAVSFDDRQFMPYTRAALFELDRYTSIGNLGILHSTVVDTSLNGHYIPKNTMVITNLWALHHNEKFWGDPWQFRPERFLDDQGELLAADHERRRHVLAFGAGPRACLGESLAQGRLFILITTVVQRFEMLPGSTPVSCDPRQYVGDGDICNSDFGMRFIPRQITMKI